MACRASEGRAAAKYGAEEEKPNAEEHSGESGDGAGEDACALEADAHVPSGVQEQQGADEEAPGPAKSPNEV